MYINRYLRTLWMIARPRTLLLIFLHGALGYFFLTNQPPETLKLILAIICIIAAYMHAVAINDISDEEVDKLNTKFLKQDKDRPLLDETLTTHQLWILLHIISIVWLIASIFVSWQVLIATLILIVLNFIYSLPPTRLSSRGGAAQAFLPVMYVVYPLFLATVLAGYININFLVLVMSLYLAFAGRLFLKDIRDEKGDRKAHKYTFLVRYGLKLTLIISATLMCIGVAALGLVIYWQTGSLIALFVALSADVGIVIVSNFLYIQKSLSKKLLDVAILGRLVSAVVFIGLLCVILSYSTINTWYVMLLQIFAVAIFAFGIIALQEEKRSIK